MEMSIFVHVHFVISLNFQLNSADFIIHRATGMSLLEVVSIDELYFELAIWLRIVGDSNRTIIIVKIGVTRTAAW